MKTPCHWLMVFPIAAASVAPAYGVEGSAAPGLPTVPDAVHLHLLTNHIPIFITLSGLVALGLALLWKSNHAQRVELILLIFGTVGGVVTLWLGQESYKPVRALADEMGQDWLDLHIKRAEQVAWLFWLAAASAVAALVMVWRHLRFALMATVVAGALAAATLGASGWIADAGGKIRHPEIRGNEVPPSDPADSHGE